MEILCIRQCQRLAPGASVVEKYPDLELGTHDPALTLLKFNAHKIKLAPETAIDFLPANAQSQLSKS